MEETMRGWMAASIWASLASTMTALTVRQAATAQARAEKSIVKH